MTKDAYEPLLPLSVVVHIDYQKAPNVIQRFGDVKKLITQTLDPMLSAYFRDVAHKKTMLELLQDRDEIQIEARERIQKRFREFDIECVDVLIGKPDTAKAGWQDRNAAGTTAPAAVVHRANGNLRTPAAAAEKLRTLNEAQALAAKQAELTNSHVQIQIAENQGDADLARARKQAEQTVVMAQANSRGGGKLEGQRRRGSGGCRSVCPRRPCCCKKCAASAIRGCLPFRWSRSNWPKASNRWCPSECLSRDTTATAMAIRRAVCWAF